MKKSGVQRVSLESQTEKARSRLGEGKGQKGHFVHGGGV